MSAIAWRPLVAGLVCLVLAQLVAGLAREQRPRPVDAEVQPEEADIGEVLVELDAGEFAGTMLLGGLRGLVADILWMRASAAREQGRVYECIALYRVIGKVQPRFAQVWEYMAHELAYNIAGEVDLESERFTWFLAGHRSLVHGLERNPRSHSLLRKFAWIHFQRGALFRRFYEAQDWGPSLNPLLARWPSAVAPVAEARLVVTDGGHQLTMVTGVPRPGRRWLWQHPDGGHSVLVESADGVDVVAGSAPAVGTWQLSEQLSSYAVAERLFAICWAAADEELRAGTSQNIRLAAIAAARDGNLRRNDGRHHEALGRYLDSLERWAAAQAWLAGAELNHIASGVAQASHQRNAGRLREQTGWLAQQLAASPAQADTWLAAIDAGDWATARQLLADPGWRPSVPGSDGIRWYDEELTE